MNSKITPSSNNKLDSQNEINYSSLRRSENPINKYENNKDNIYTYQEHFEAKQSKFKQINEIFDEIIFNYDEYDKFPEPIKDKIPEEGSKKKKNDIEKNEKANKLRKEKENKIKSRIEKELFSSFDSKNKEGGYLINNVFKQKPQQPTEDINSSFFTTNFFQYLQKEKLDESEIENSMSNSKRKYSSSLKHGKQIDSDTLDPSPHQKLIKRSNSPQKNQLNKKIKKNFIFYFCNIEKKFFKFDISRKENTNINSENPNEFNQIQITALQISHDNLYLATDQNIIKIYTYCNNDNIKFSYELQTSHKSTINVLAINSDQNKLISSSIDGFISLFTKMKEKFSVNESVLELKKEKEEYENLFYFYNDDIIYTYFGKMSVFPLVEKIIRHTDIITSLINGDIPITVNNEQITKNLLITSSRDHFIRFFNFDSTNKKISEEKLLEIDCKMPILAIALNKSKKYIFSSSIDNVIRIWNIEFKKMIMQFDFLKGFTKKIQLTEEGNYMVFGLPDKTIQYFSISTIQENLFNHTNLIQSCIINQKGDKLYFGSNDEYKKKQQSNKNDYVIEANFIHELQLEDDINNKNDQILNILDVNTIKPGFCNDLHSILLTKNQKKLIASSSDKIIIYNLENVKKNEIETTVPKNPSKGAINLITLLNDETLIVVSEKNIYFLIKFEQSFLFQEKCHDDFIGSLGVSPNEETIVTCGGKLDMSIKLWDIANKKLIKQINNAHNQQITNIIISKQNNKIISGSKDNTIKIWNFSLKYLDTLIGHNDEITNFISTKNNILISGSADGDIRLWDLMNYRNIGVLRGHSSAITCMSLNIDKNFLISISDDNIIRKWELSTYKSAFSQELVAESAFKLNRWKGFQNQETNLQYNEKPSVSYIEMTDDEKYIIIGKRDGTISVWDLSKTSESDGIILDKNYKSKNSAFISENVRENQGIVSIKIKYYDIKDEYRIWAACADNKIRYWELSNKKLVYDENEILIIDGSINCLNLLNERYLIYGIDKNFEIIDIDLKSIDKIHFSFTKKNTTMTLKENENENLNKNYNSHIKDKENDKFHQDLIISLDSYNNLILTGSKDMSFILWKIEEEKHIVFLHKFTNHKGIVTFIKFVNDGRKIISVSTDNKIMFWDRETYEYIKSYDVGSGFYVTSTYLDKSKRLLLLNNRIIDLHNDILLFENNHKKNRFNLFKTAFSNKFKKMYLISEENNDLIIGSLISENIFDYFKSFSVLYYFFGNAGKKDLSTTKNSLFLKVINGAVLLYPSFSNFLHLNALGDNKGDFHIFNLSNYKLSLEIFLQVDYKQRTCFDILIEKNVVKEINKELISIYFKLAFDGFDRSTTTYYQKFKFLNYDFKNNNKNIIHLITDLLKIFQTDTWIINELFNKSFLVYEQTFELCNTSIDKIPYYIIANNKKFNDFEYQKPVLTQSEEFFIHYIIFKPYNFLSKIFQKFNNEEFFSIPTNLKCNIIALPNIINFEKSEVKELYTLIFQHLPISNEIFANKTLRIITEYKWNTYLKYRYIGQLLYFLIYMALFHFNFLYTISISNSDGFHGINIIRFLFNIMIYIYMLLYFWKELKSIFDDSFNKYISSIWNWIDMLLIGVVLITVTYDMYTIFLFPTFEEEQIFKIIFSISTFLSWTRLLSFYRGFSSTGFFIRLILGVIYDIRHFLLIVFTWILCFTFSGFLLQTEYNSSVFGYFLIFYRLVLGDLNKYDDEQENIYFPIAIWVLLMFSTILLTIILLNLLIAIINNTFTNVLNTETKTRNFELMNLVYDLELTLASSKYFEKKTNKYDINTIGKYILYIAEEPKQINQNEVQEKILIEIKHDLSCIMNNLNNKKKKNSSIQENNNRQNKISKLSHSNIIIKTAKDIFQVLFEIKQRLGKLRKDEMKNENIYWINATLIFSEALKESMTELFYIAKNNFNKFEFNSVTKIQLLLHDIDEFYKLFLLKDEIWTVSNQRIMNNISKSIKMHTISLNLSFGLHFNLMSAKISNLTTINKKLNYQHKQKEYKKFKNLIAGNIWVHLLNNQKNITFRFFLPKIKEFISLTEKVQLNDYHINILRENLQNENHMVSFEQWNDFYTNFWSNYSKKIEFLTNYSFQLENEKEEEIEIEKNKLKFMNMFQLENKTIKNPQDNKKLTLIYEDLSNNNYKPFKNDKITITKTKYEFEDSKNKYISNNIKNLVEVEIIFGRTSQIFAPDIYFDSTINSVSKIQFQITMSNNTGNFLINDLSESSETSFLVESKKYILSKDLLIELNGSTYLIKNIYPENPLNMCFNEIEENIPENKLNEYKNIEENITESKLNETKEIEENQLKKNIKYLEKKNIFYLKRTSKKNEFHSKKIEKNKQILELECLTEEENPDLKTINLNNRQLEYKFGESDDNDIIINSGSPNFNCKICYNEEIEAWTIESNNKQNNNNNKCFSHTMILMKNKNEFENDLDINLNGFELKDGMRIYFNLHSFLINITKE